VYQKLKDDFTIKCLTAVEGGGSKAKG